MTWEEGLTGLVESGIELQRKKAPYIEVIEDLERLAAAHRCALIMLEGCWHELKSKQRRQRQRQADG